MAEVVLDRGKCLYLRRPIAFSGTLVVTNRRVQFEPSTLDRAVGAKPWECAVNRIDKIEFTRVTRVMLIYTGSTVRRLLGKEVAHLYERLSSLVPKSDPNEAAFQFEPGERVLLRERVLKVVNRFFWTSGHLTLTDRRIRFQPQRGLDRWLWKNQSVDAQLDALVIQKFDPVRKRLTVLYNKQPSVFSGALIPRVYAVLSGLAADEKTSDVIGCWPGYVQDATLARKGELVATLSNIIFVTSGSLDAALGRGTRINIAVSTLSRIHTEGTVDAKLLFEGDDGTHSFMVPNPRQRLEELIPGLLAADHPDDPPVDPDTHLLSRESAAQLLEPWRELLEIRGKKILLAGPGVHLSSRPEIRRGWLVLTENEAVYLPRKGEAYGAHPIVFPTKLIVPPHDESTHGPQLKLTAGGASVRLLPRGEDAFVRRFWLLWGGQRKRSMQEAEVRQRVRRAGQRIVDPEGFNRRETYRAPLEEEDRIRVTALHAGQPVHGTGTICPVVNLSEGGLCIETTSKFPIDTELAVDLGTPAVEGAIVGRVVYSNRVKNKGIRTGIEFTKLTVEQSLGVRALVMARQRETLVGKPEESDSSAEELPTPPSEDTET